MRIYVPNSIVPATEGFGTKDSVERTVSKLERISKTFGEFTETVNIIKITDKNKPKYKEGDVGVKGPSSVVIAERNWQFYRAFKKVVESKGKIDTTQELNKVYSELVDVKYLGKSSGYKLATLPEHQIEFPKSGWFAFPIINIERAIVNFPKLCKTAIDTLKSMDDASGFQEVVEKLFLDLQNVVEKETLGTANKLKAKAKKEK